MSANPTNSEIMDALEESGYLLEQRVGTQLEALDFHVTTNVAFEDPDEGKSREIDVSAIRRVAHNEAAKVSAFVDLMVECKNSSNPLVFITRPKNAADGRMPPSELRFPSYKMTKDLGRGSSASREIHGFFHLGFDKIHYRHRLAAKAVQFCRIDRKGSGWHANHGGLYDAMFYPMAKAVTAHLANVPRNSSTDAWKYLWLMFPLIVTTGDLLVVDSTDPNPVPSQRDWVGFSRDLKSGKLSGIYTVDFVRRDAIEKFVHECIDPLAALAKELVEQKADFLLRAEIPWEE